MNVCLICLICVIPDADWSGEGMSAGSGICGAACERTEHIELSRG